MNATAANANAIPKAGGNFRWVICALLFFVITINYVDRQVIGVLKPVIEDDLGWSEVDYGNIVTAFQASSSCVTLGCSRGWRYSHSQNPSSTKPIAPVTRNAARQP